MGSVGLGNLVKPPGTWKQWGILHLWVLLAATETTNASLDCTPHAFLGMIVAGGAVRVSVASTMGTTAARLHFCAGVAGTLVFLESSLNCERRLTLALQVVRVVLLRHC